MKANIINPQIFNKIMNDLKGHRESHKVTFILKIQLLLRYPYYLKSDLIKTLYA